MLRYHDWTKRDCLPLALRRADEIRDWQRYLYLMKTGLIWLILAFAAGAGIMAAGPR